MPVEFVGHVGSRAGSDVVPASGPVVDKEYIRRIARAAEDHDFDRLLIGSFSTIADNNQIAAFVLHETQRLGVMLAHRTGFVPPTIGARQLATLDHFSDGRLGVHIITGGTDEDQQRDGDFLNKDDRYTRTDEYLDVLKRVWSSDTPFDHEGRFYKFKGAFSTVKPFQQPRIPIYFGGSSDAAIEVAGKHADVYALWGEPLDGTRETIARVRAAAAKHGRADQIRFVLAFRPVVAETEAKAWERADRILEAVKARGGVDSPNARTQGLPMNVGSVRLREAAARGRVLDKRLWTEVAAVSGAGGNSTALVGTGEQVAESLLDYYDLGVTTFLVRCFYPEEDTVTYGREVIGLVRQEVARREAQAAVHQAAGQSVAAE
ncbi:LLM class flavin-dependent oxidoreductase [Sphingobium sufflavum]|uniref:LLM class flavin-dependent oxidoreductase n=1 Tax=Sphingobium sufflavum TaxID=1129547 RepID=UPI001F15D88D|nr:LLM class flavin-dependent oxidoreductase [Sphingobium sufflavum]MCE7796136.1 LLM class flavin-dependent oxidoreductase [Sphingobium sufflavum]